MMNCKRFGRKRKWPNFKALSRHSPGVTDGKHKKPQPGYTVFRPRFETGTSWIWSRLVNHSTTTFGPSFLFVQPNNGLWVQITRLTDIQDTTRNKSAFKLPLHMYWFYSNKLQRLNLFWAMTTFRNGYKVCLFIHRFYQLRYQTRCPQASLDTRHCTDLPKTLDNCVTNWTAWHFLIAWLNSPTLSQRQRLVSNKKTNTSDKLVVVPKEVTIAQFRALLNINYTQEFFNPIIP
jgi:hypothetical protein